MKFECRLRLIFAEKKQKDQSFTQGGFAESVGISKAALSALVNEKNPPTFEVAYKISRGLNMPIEEIWVVVEDQEEK